MLVRAAGFAPAVLLALLPASAFALAPAAATQVVPAARIAAFAARIARNSVLDPDRALAPAFTIADQNVPAGSVAIDAGTPQVNATYVSVPIAIDIDGKVVRTLYAGFRITTYVRMAVAARDLAPDTVLAPDDLTYARLPFDGRPPLEITTFIGRKLRAVVARGSLISPDQTVTNVIVRAGMPAVLIVHDGPVRLAADVVARTSGGLGDSVTIFNPQTQKALSGVVTGPDTVELTLPGAN